MTDYQPRDLVRVIKPVPGIRKNATGTVQKLGYQSSWVHVMFEDGSMVPFKHDELEMVTISQVRRAA